MKDLFAQFNDGRLSPTERQTKAIEGIWKSLDGIDRSLAKLVSKREEEITSKALNDELVDVVENTTAHDDSGLNPALWSDEMKEKMRIAFRHRQNGGRINKSDAMRAWLIYNWNLYCDEYKKWKDGYRRLAPLLRDLMRDLGAVNLDYTGTKRLYVMSYGILTLSQYQNKEKLEVNED